MKTCIPRNMGFFLMAKGSEMYYNMEVKNMASGTVLPGLVASFRHCVFLDTLLNHSLP